MEYVSLILIMILFALGFVAYKVFVVSPKQKQEKLVKKLHSWVKSFDQLDELSDRDERSSCLHGLLVERRVLLKELSEDVSLQGLIHQLESADI